MPITLPRGIEVDAHNIAIGRKMGDNDVWIAATAHITGATLLTTDKDFDHLHPLFLQREWIDPHVRRRYAVSTHPSTRCFSSANG